VEKISIKKVVVVKKLTGAFSVVFYTVLLEVNMATHLNNMATLLSNMAIHRSRVTLLRAIPRSRVDILHKGTSRATLHKGTRPPLTAVILEGTTVWGEC
jgi:hypothetical protein